MLGLELVNKTLMITVFVTVMMLLVEYLNVRTRGLVLDAFGESPWRQYIVAALLGALPGCLGAYAVVALFMHRRLSIGAVVAAMIATSGDEMFVMLALFPATAAWMTALLALLGIVAGWLTDRALPASIVDDSAMAHELELHDETRCRCFEPATILSDWRPPSPYRATLTFGLLLVVIALVSGHVGPVAWGWKRVTLMVLISLGLFIAATVPEHFLEEHLWRHVVLQHVPRIFLWTLGVFVVLALLQRFVDLPALLSINAWANLAVASTLGLLPESGPHLTFVVMYADGIIPASILFASSIVQDGHGMLPLLSASRRTFVIVKLINLLFGVMVGAAMLAAGS